MELTTAIAGTTAYVMAGDARGPTIWTETRLDEPSGENARARVALPSDATWAVASMSPSFEQAQGEWLVPPAWAGACDATAAGVSFSRFAVATPPVPRITLAYDGASIALVAREARKDHARRIALAFAALALAVLVGLVLTAGLRRDPAGLESVSVGRRQRVVFAAASASVLLVGGVVLLTAYILRF
jgi:hypothetical protein